VTTGDEALVVWKHANSDGVRDEMNSPIAEPEVVARLGSWIETALSKIEAMVEISTRPTRELDQGCQSVSTLQYWKLTPIDSGHVQI
jgi:hypothetical protein